MKVISTICAVAGLFAVSLQAQELKVTPFAQSPMLKNATAVHVDDQGRVFAVETTRRKGGEWTLGDRARSYGIATIEEKRAYLEELKKAGATISGVKDNNGDGKNQEQRQRAQQMPAIPDVFVVEEENDEGEEAS